MFGGIVSKAILKFALLLRFNSSFIDFPDFIFTILIHITTSTTSTSVCNLATVKKKKKKSRNSKVFVLCYLHFCQSRNPQTDEFCPPQRVHKRRRRKSPAWIKRSVRQICASSNLFLFFFLLPSIYLQESDGEPERGCEAIAQRHAV